MIHRALLGSLERFIGILIEHFGGAFPMWLAPTQIVLTGITSDQNDAVVALRQRLVDAGFRAETDLRNEKVNFKVREHSLTKTPLIGVIGNREIEEGTVSLRRLGSPRPTVVKVEDLLAQLAEEVSTRALPAGFEKQDD